MAVAASPGFPLLAVAVIMHETLTLNVGQRRHVQQVVLPYDQPLQPVAMSGLCILEGALGEIFQSLSPQLVLDIPMTSGQRGGCKEEASPPTGNNCSNFVIMSLTIQE